MKLVRPLGSLVVFLGVVTLACPCFSDEGELRKFVASYVEAFNTGKVETVAKFWAEDAVHTDEITGAKTIGREAIQADLQEAFKASPNATMSGMLESVQFITENVAKIEGEVAVDTGVGSPSVAAFTAVLIQKDGHWVFASVDETEYASESVTPASLEQLGWLVGRWTDPNAESKIDSEFRWSANNTFLLRSFRKVEPSGEGLAGTQVIAVDPRSNEIRSWTFLSDGSFGDEVWSEEGETWTIRSVQTLADGRAASGTYVLQKVSENELSVQLVGHEIEGVPQPTMPAVLVTRATDDSPAVNAEASGDSAADADPNPASR